MILRISEPSVEGVFQASKWLKIQVLLDGDEMKSLIESLGTFWIFPMTGIVNGKPIEHSFFIEEYSRWIADLKEGKLPNAESLRRIMAAVFTDDVNALWLQQVGNDKYLTKIRAPIVQVQTHYFSYSSVDQVFRPMSMGLNSIFWGLQFSFPQIYQDPKTMEFHQVSEMALFRKIQLWVRENTRATPFLVDGKKINSSIRLGKKCFPWINSHQQLIDQHIQVGK